ncbi:MAG: four-carbon acid sugar kinase family protein, partial [Solirubrobacteraceae bacterium]
MPPLRRLTIVADDLAGAADCGVGFAERGFTTGVVLGAEQRDPGGWSVIALDTDTRDARPELAQQRVRDALAVASPDDLVFKKIDSTLRGNIAAELRATASERGDCCVVAAPAFPATGRTTRDGRQLIDGRPLEESEFAAQVDTSVLRDLLAPSGLTVRDVSLAQVRAGVAEVVQDAGPGVVLACDAETDEDLALIGRGGVDSGCHVIWMGTAGLARQLAGLLPLAPGSGNAPARRREGPVLLVVGSPAAATHAQLGRLRRVPNLVEVCVSDVDAAAAAAAVRDALGSGCDCALTLGGEAGDRDAGRG